jgi:hypothetical protein
LREFSQTFSNSFIGERMSISLVIERNDGINRADIALPEWRNIVAADSELRMAVQPTQVRNPQTGELIGIAPAQGTSEIYLEEKWIPFLEWQRGRLSCRYSEEMETETPQNPVRIKIAYLSRKLDASIFVDVQDEPLAW